MLFRAYIVLEAQYTTFRCSWLDSWESDFYVTDGHIYLYSSHKVEQRVPRLVLKPSFHRLAVHRAMHEAIPHIAINGSCRRCARRGPSYSRTTYGVCPPRKMQILSPIQAVGESSPM